MNRPLREAYARASRPCCNGATVEAGIELRPGDDFHRLRNQLAETLVWNDPVDETDPIRIAEPVERAIKATWPDRAYFMEIWAPGDDGGWLQIFQPFGVPRNA